MGRKGNTSYVFEFAMGNLSPYALRLGLGICTAIQGFAFGYGYIFDSVNSMHSQVSFIYKRLAYFNYFYLQTNSST